MAKEDEVVMKDWMKNFRPDRQLNIRSETTKDKAGSLLPAVYSQPKQTEHLEFNTEPTAPDDSSTPSPVSETIEQSDHSPGIYELQAVSLTFVKDLDVPEVHVKDIQQQDEYETDSDTERDVEVKFEVVSKTCMTGSKRAVRTFVPLRL